MGWVSFVGVEVRGGGVYGARGGAVAAVNKGLAAIGGLFGIASETIALALGSSPQSLHGGLMVLSDSYVAAPGAADRDRLVGAADALIAATNAVSWAGILTAAGILVLSLVMWQGMFGRALAVVGIVAGLIGLFSEAFRPMIGPAYLVYGLLLPLWFGWVGWKLIRIETAARTR